MAVGFDTEPISSPDGTNWTSGAFDFLSDILLRGVAFGDGVFVTVGEIGIVSYTSDGYSWNGWEQIDPNLEFTSVTFKDGYFVAVGGRGVEAFSQDGMNWTPLPRITDQTLLGITSGDNGFVAVGEQGVILQSGATQPASPTLGPVVGTLGSPVQIGLQGTPGQTYFIQASADLIEWATIGQLTLTGSSGTFVDTTATNYLHHFYQAFAQ